MRLVRIRNDKKYIVEREIVFPLTIPKYERTSDELMKNVGIRIPAPEELLCQVYEDGILGHITTREEIELKRKQKTEMLEKEILTLRLQNTVYSDMMNQLSHKIKMNNLKISDKENYILNNKKG